MKREFFTIGHVAGALGLPPATAAGLLRGGDEKRTRMFGHLVSFADAVLAAALLVAGPAVTPAQRRELQEVLAKRQARAHLVAAVDVEPGQDARLWLLAYPGARPPVVTYLKVGELPPPNAVAVNFSRLAVWLRAQFNAMGFEPDATVEARLED